MKKIQINIVGFISDREEIKEIENVAKVFIVEERMINITNLEKENINEKTTVDSQRKIKIHPNNIEENPQFLPVRGLN